jgi:4a-hydroxytetrahydrobiopterin dehydratase
MSDKEWAGKFDAAGLSNWAVRNAKAQLEVDCGSFTAAGRLAARLAELSDKVEHHPEIDVRAPGTVLVTTWTKGSGGLTGDDMVLAKRVNMLLDADERAREAPSGRG